MSIYKKLKNGLRLTILSCLLFVPLVSTRAHALSEVPINSTPAHRALGVYPGFGNETGINRLGSIENFLGRKIGFTAANLDHNTWSAFGGSSWGQFENNDSYKTRTDVQVAITIPLRVDETGARTKKSGGPELIRQELLATANGDNDDRYRTVGKRMIENGHSNAILRLGHESDIAYYPWSIWNGNEDVYKLAFRRVATIFKSLPGQNFLIDFNVNGGATQSHQTRNGTTLTRTEAAYPGDDVVDIIGLDVYNGSDRWAGAKSKLDYILQFAKSRNKPISLPEWGLRISQTGDDPSFIQNMYDWIQNTPANGGGRLIYHNYFWQNSDANLDKTPLSKAKFKELFGAQNIKETSGGIEPVNPNPPATSQNPPTTSPTPIQKPDLIIEPNSFTTIPANPKSGDEVLFKVTIKNVGAGPTPSGTTHGAAFIINGEAQSWSTGSKLSLAPGQSRILTSDGGPDGNSTWRATEGNSAIEIRLDAQDRISESNENNNSLSKQITVSGAPSATQKDQRPPTRPGRPQVNLKTTSKVILSWNQSSDESGTVSYRIYRNGELIGSSTSSSFTDSSINTGTSYDYHIVAFDPSGNTSANSDVLSVSIETPQVTKLDPVIENKNPISIKVEGLDNPVAIEEYEVPTISGNIELINTFASEISGDLTTELFLNGVKIKSQSGNSLNIDTTSIPNGEHLLTIRTQNETGEAVESARVVIVDNQLNYYERIRNSIFGPFNGTVSTSTMDIMMASFAALLVIPILVVLIWNSRWFELNNPIQNFIFRLKMRT